MEKVQIVQGLGTRAENSTFWPVSVRTGMGEFILDIHKKSSIFDNSRPNNDTYFNQFLRDEYNIIYILKGDYSGLSIIKIPHKLHRPQYLGQDFTQKLSKYFESELGMFLSFIDPIHLFPDTKLNLSMEVKRRKVALQLKENFSNTHVIWAPYFLRELKIELECVLLLFKAMAGHD